LTFAVDGLKFSDTTATVLTGALTRASGETVAGGPYAIAQGTLAAISNYAIGFTSNALTIARAPLSVTADPKTKTLGAADPAFTATYVGFVNGETTAVLTGTLTFSRAPGESVGSYLITPSDLTGTNYFITFNTGTLTIVPANPAPMMLPLTLSGTTNIVIAWTAVSNAIYRVQYNATLGSTNWTALVGDVTATGGTASKTDILTSSNRFYRVQILP
jgi:hypothetical protein